VKLLITLIAALAFASVSLGAKASIQSRSQVEKLHNLITENAALKVELKRERKLKGRAQRRVRAQYLLIDRLRKEHRRAIRHYPSIPHLIEVAATAYGQSYSMLLRKADCESGLWPFSRNNSSKDSPMGLLQFRPSTWRSTPFAGFSIWDPFAQSLAGAWMHDVGRGGEWACR
jgi:hypothetical protein